MPNPQGEAQAVLEASQKRIWYARNQLMDNLTALGLPAGITDGSHAMVRGVRSTASWLIGMSDPIVSKLMAGGNPARWEKAMAVFSNLSPIQADAIKPIAPTGFSIKGGGVVIDGCALRIAMPDGAGDAFVIPISRNALADGDEWTEMVAMVPMAAMPVWASLTGAASVASRSLDASRLVMRVYNGPDIRISPMSLDDLVLEPDVKSAFADDILGFLGRRDWYGERNLPWTRKYLLDGPPGTGKTSLARWAASALGMPCMGFDFTDRYADGRTLNGCLSQAASMAPCLLVLDDIDKVLAGGNNTGITTHALQTALSGMGNLDGVIVVATSNSTKAIKGILADGSENPLARRFDQIISVPLPTAALRVEYASRLLSKDGISAGDLTGLVGGQTTEGWSYDDVRAAVTAAAGQAVKRGSDTISIDDMRRGVAAVAQRKLAPAPSATARAAGEDGSEEP